ncbi:MAG: Poly(3-hydroxyalkanoate) depolymerase, partial [uncultured Gemmatimonadetes bacterium]
APDPHPVRPDDGRHPVHPRLCPGPAGTPSRAALGRGGGGGTRLVRVGNVQRPGRQPAVQGVPPRQPAPHGPRAHGGDAARVHAGPGRLRPGHADQRAGLLRGVDRRLSRADRGVQSPEVLELVRSGQPGARRGRAGHHRRHHPRADAPPPRRSRARLHRRRQRGRGDGRQHRGRLPGAVRRRRRALRHPVPRGGGRGVGRLCHALRPRQPRRAPGPLRSGRRGRSADRLSRRRRRRRERGERPAPGRPVAPRRRGQGLHPPPGGRRRAARHARRLRPVRGTVDGRRAGPRLVRRLAGGHLHLRGRAGRQPRDAALLPAAPGSM